MSDPKPLSPAAQKIINAAAGGFVPDTRAFPLLCHEIAAALRAAADQGEWLYDSLGHAYPTKVDAVRVDHLRAWAAELDPTPPAIS